MKRLIVTADDAGLDAARTRAAREARERGVVTAAVIVSTGAAFDEVAAWAAADPALGVGAHLDLAGFFHADTAVPSPLWEYRDARVPVPALLEAIRGQIRRLLDRGLRVTHLSSRHHLHLRPELFPLVCDAAGDLGVRAVRVVPSWWTRVEVASAAWLMGFPAKRRLAFAPHFIDGWYWGNVDEDFSVAELACRPSPDDDAGRRDLAACCDPRLRDHLRNTGVELVTHGSL